MAISLSDLFPMLRSAKGGTPPAESVRHWQRSLGRRKGAHKRVAAPRASAISFETIEPRVLLSADSFNMALATYLDDPQLGTNSAVMLVDDGVGLLSDAADAAFESDALAEGLKAAIPGLLVRNGLPSEFNTLTLEEVLRKNGDGAFDIDLGDYVDDLLGGPSGRRRGRDVEVQDAAPVVRHGEEDVEHAERDRGNHEEVDRDDVCQVVLQE